MRWRSVARFASTIALSLCLSALLLALITGIIAFRTVVNPWYVVRQIERSGFSDHALTELREVYITYGLGSGISRGLMSSLITVDHVSDAAEGSVLEAYSIGAGFDFDAYVDEMYHILLDYVVAQGVPVTAELEIGLRDLAVLNADTLRGYADSPIFTLLAQTQRYNRVLVIAIVASAIMSFIVIIIIPLVNRRVTRWIDGYIYALGSTALICTALPVAVFASGLTTRLQISPMSYNRLISSWLEGILNAYLVALIPLLLLICVCAIVRIARWKKRTKKQNTASTGI